MKVLVTGGGGMLARALVPTLKAAGHHVLALNRSELDVTDGAAVDRCLRQVRPAIVVQCAAYTAVDRAEVEEELAELVNGIATGYVAESCQNVGAMLVYPSTDYVFAGRRDRPYRPEDRPEPVNAYGRSKLAGERAAAKCDRFVVLRTSWLYGPGGGNFVETIRRLAEERMSLEVVDDQRSRPTSTTEFSRAVVLLLKVGALGTFHAAGGGQPTTWFGFATEIVEQLGLSVELRPVASSAFPRPARRPAYSVLDCSATERLTGREFADWRESLAEYLQGGHSGR
jgi:dTDP-4-dehydrorhamnose reductase